MCTSRSNGGCPNPPKRQPITLSPKHPRTTAEIRGEIEAEAEAAPLRLSILDDGIGGADSSKGLDSSASSIASRRSGSRIEISSPAGNGTSLQGDSPVRPGRRSGSASRVGEIVDLRWGVIHLGLTFGLRAAQAVARLLGRGGITSGRCCRSGRGDRCGDNRRRSSPRRNQQCEAAWFRSYAGPPLRGSCATVHRPLTQSRKASPP